MAKPSTSEDAATKPKFLRWAAETQYSDNIDDEPDLEVYHFAVDLFRMFHFVLHLHCSAILAVSVCVTKQSDFCFVNSCPDTKI